MQPALHRSDIAAAAKSVKARYLLGKGLVQLGDLEGGRDALNEAIGMSSSQEYATWQESVEAELKQAELLMWKRQKEDDEWLKQECNHCLTTHVCMGREVIGGKMLAQIRPKEVDARS